MPRAAHILGKSSQKQCSAYQVCSCHLLPGYMYWMHFYRPRKKKPAHKSECRTPIKSRSQAKHPDSEPPDKSAYMRLTRQTMHAISKISKRWRIYLKQILARNARYCMAVGAQRCALYEMQPIRAVLVERRKKRAEFRGVEKKPRKKN